MTNKIPVYKVIEEVSRSAVRQISASEGIPAYDLRCKSDRQDNVICSKVTYKKNSNQIWYFVTFYDQSKQLIGETKLLKNVFARSLNIEKEVISSQYFQVAMNMTGLVIKAGATDVEQIVDTAIALTDKLIEKVGEMRENQELY